MCEAYSLIKKEFKRYCLGVIGAKIYPYILLIKLHLFSGASEKSRCIVNRLIGYLETG